jgi:hypothetical protein
MSRPLHLRVVGAEAPDAACSVGRHRKMAEQPTLFIAGNDRALAFVDMDAMTEERFVALLDARPVTVVDLRDTPRFDYGTLTRRKVFESFERLSIVYRDVGATCHDPSLRGSVIDVGALSRGVQRVLAQQKRLKGPVVFLCENKRSAAAVADIVPEIVKPSSRKRWELFIA